MTTPFDSAVEGCSSLERDLSNTRVVDNAIDEYTSSYTRPAVVVVKRSGNKAIIYVYVTYVHGRAFIIL